MGKRWTGKCSVPACDRPKGHISGLCKTHRERVRNSGENADLTTPIRDHSDRVVAECSVDWCDRPVTKKGYCETHYGRRERGADMDMPFRFRRSRDDAIVEGCLACESRGEMCNTHFQQTKNHKVSPMILAAMLSGGCEVCGAMDSGNGRALHIDHDHDCCGSTYSCGNCIRGILCNRHNLLAGFLETPDAAAVLAYLQQFGELKIMVRQEECAA